MASPRRNESNESIDLRQQSSEYAEKATKLSNLLEQAEEYFSSLPGKISVSTFNEEYDNYEGQDYLKLVKDNRGWVITLHYFDEEHNERVICRVTSASLPLKVRAAKLLPELHQQLQNYFASIKPVLDEGLEHLEKLDFLDHNSSVKVSSKNENGGA